MEKMEKEKKNVNMNINDGESFFAHEISINFNPLQFILDFKNITPRIDPRSQESIVLSMKHNVIMMDPWQAKRVLALLDKVVKDYEKEFGTIEKPKALKKYEEKASKKIKTAKGKAPVPNYFG